LNLFSGFRGSGKTTELFRLRQRLTESDYVVLYADALDYINPSAPIEISDVLIVLAGAFSDALEELKIDIRSEAWWTRLRNWLTKTEVGVKELGLKTDAGIDPVKAGVDLKLELRTAQSFREKLWKALSGRISELYPEVTAFFEDGFKGIRAQPRRRRAGGLDVRLPEADSRISLERTGGYQERRTTFLKLLEAARDSLSACGLHRPAVVKVSVAGHEHGRAALPAHVEQGLRAIQVGARNSSAPIYRPQAFYHGRLTRFFGPDPFSRASRLIELCGGHFRDQLLLLRETVLRATSLPVSDDVIDAPILNVRSNYPPIALEDARWLAEIERKRSTLLKSNAKAP
jgi:hypothetical protein